MTRLVLFWLVLLCLASRPAYADEKDQARAAFKEGVAAFQSGDYERALHKFEDADRAAHSPAITYNIARTLEKLEKPQRAVDAYEAYVAETGESGEFMTPATVAIAQIKGRSSRLRVETTPPGATVAVDGDVLPQRTPVAILIARGQHTVTVELDGWREQREYVAPGGASTGELVFVRVQSPAPPAPPAQEPKPAAPPAPKDPEIDGLMGTAGLSLSGYRFIGSAEEQSGAEKTTADSTPGGLVFGLAFDVGYALNHRTALLLRGFGGLGAAESSLASLGAAGPVLSYRISSRWWIGGGVAVGAGRADADATKQRSLVNADSQITFETDFALGPTLELGYVLDQNDDGHWLVSLLPTTLFTTGGEESTLFIALMLGYRWF